MIVRIDPPMPLNTPRGSAMAHFLIDYGIEFDLYWVCFIDETSECWTISNRDIRAQSNITIGRTPLSKAMPTTDHSSSSSRIL
jgi:hypothetical protein